MALWVYIIILLYTLQIHNNTTIDNMNIIIIIISSQYEINNKKNLERGHKKKITNMNYAVGAFVAVVDR